VKLTKTIAEFNQVDLQKIFMSFNTLLKLLSIDKETHINALQIKLKNQQFSYKDYVKTYEQISLVFMLEISGKQTQMFNLYLTLTLQLVTTHFFFKKKLKNDKRVEFFFINYNEKKIETHICIQKMGNVFFNSQQIITNL